MKKTMLLLLVLCMGINLFAGCAFFNKEDVVDTSSEEESATESTTEPVNENPERTYGKYDGEVFTIVGSPGAGDLNASEIDYDITTVKNESIPQAVYKRTLAVEEKLDIEIVTENVFWEGLNPWIIQSDMAGGGDYDALCGRAEVIAQVVTGGYYFNLQEIPTLDLSADWWDTSMNDSFSIYPNTTFFAVGDINYMDDYGASVMIYNTEMCRDEGIDPYTWVKEGSWTIEKLAETITGLSQDYMNDGVWDENDTYGFVNNGGLLSGLLIASDTHLVTMVDDYPTMTRRTTLIDKSYYIFQKLIDNDEVLIVERELGYAKGDKVFPNGHAYFSSSQVMDYINLKYACDFQIGVIPYPKYDSQQMEYYSPCSHMYMSVYVVPRNHNDLEMTGDVLDCMGEKSVSFLTPVVVTEPLYYRGQVDEKNYEMLTLALKNKRVDLGVFYNWAGLYDLTYQITHYRNFTLASALESYSGDINASIDKTVEAMRLMMNRN